MDADTGGSALALLDFVQASKQLQTSQWSNGAKMTSYRSTSVPTSLRRIDVNTNSFLRYVPLGYGEVFTVIARHFIPAAAKKI